jgi:hypothetical protein
MRKTILTLSVFVCVHLWLVAGCSWDSQKQPATRPSGVAERQDAALRDPFGYSPNMDQRDVSGGSLGNYDRAGMKRDIDHVLNP